MARSRTLPCLLLFVLLTSACSSAPRDDAPVTTPGAGQASVRDDDSQPDVVKVAVGSPDHSTLVAALKAGELVDALANAGPFTVFAPTNAAFDKLPAGTVETPPAAPADPAVEAPGGTAAADPAAAGATGLAGTKWQLGEYVVDFKDDGKVLVKGGQIATLMPDGAEGEYKVEDGKFSVSVLGQSFNGTWDGSKLVVDGNEAVPQ